ncbi:MAG: hypothetical protein OEZ48_07280 [Candidatus Bathyarchaeota archaeon]|nr:hypothetical protein [Candidatus Bathyarchaeota archaeon]MDH5687648.1 hypothetical protein [Candidatus Bathyarchaeota archaeon]
MNKTKTIDVQALQRDAENSEHKEAYRVLDRSSNYRIGVGARLTPSGQPSFFLEVVVQSCLESSEVDLQLLEKNLMFLKELKARGYSLNCEGDGSISCEVNVSPQNVASEYENIRLTIRNIFL